MDPLRTTNSLRLIGNSTHLREAARMDGANSAQLLLLVELPTWCLSFCWLSSSVLLTLPVFDNIYVLVGSGAGGTSTSLSIYIYKAFFEVEISGKPLQPPFCCSRSRYWLLCWSDSVVEWRPHEHVLPLAGLWLAALLFNFPLISTLLTSLKSEGEIVSNPSILIQSPTFANYVKISKWLTASISSISSGLVGHFSIGRFLCALAGLSWPTSS